MKTNILIKINTQYNSFTPGEQRIADAVLSGSSRELISMSISQLAYMTHTSEASVFRFCRKLGLEGFQEFRDCLLDQALRQPSQQHRLRAPDRPRDPESINEITEYLLSQYHETISMTRDILQSARVSTVVEWMKGSDSVNFFGAGASLISAQQAKLLFMRCLKRVTAYPSLYLQEQNADTLSSRDLAIVFSVSGATPSIVHIAEKLKKNGVRVVAVTAYEKTPISAYVDLSLLTFPGGSNDNYVTLSSCITQMVLISVLYNALWHHLPADMNNSALYDAIRADNMI